MGETSFSDVLILSLYVYDLTAHTRESARTLVDMVKTLFPSAKLALVVAMASDKDHTGFAKEFLSGSLPPSSYFYPFHVGLEKKHSSRALSCVVFVYSIISKF